MYMNLQKIYRQIHIYLQNITAMFTNKNKSQQVGNTFKYTYYIYKTFNNITSRKVSWF